MLKRACLVLVLGIVMLGAFAQDEVAVSTTGAVTPERTIAGITVGKSWDHVLNLYGLPDEIIVGLQAGVGTPAGGFPGMMGAGMPGMMGPAMQQGARPGVGMPGMMPGAGMPGMMMGSGMMGSGMPGMMGPAMQQGARPGVGMPGMMSGAGMPGMMMGSGMMGSGMPGMMGPGMGPMPGMRPAGTATPMGGPVGPQGGVFPLPGITSATAGAGISGGIPTPPITVSPDKMLWIYRLKGGITLRVTLAQADGRVVEVTVSGNKWDKARTSKGITLGSHYTDVLKAYGWPEETSTSDGNIFCRYDQSYHIIFGIRGSDKKVISITVTM